MQLKEKNDSGAGGRAPACARRRATSSYASEWLEAFAVLGVRLLEMAEPLPGALILDLACGAGEPALGAARYLRGRGWVLGADTSKSALLLARQRARRLGLRGLSFALMNGETLSCKTGAFDLALCRLGVIVVPDPDRMLAEVRRAVRDGGLLAVATWGDGGKTPLLDVTRGVVGRELARAGQVELAAPQGFATPGTLAAALKAAGFRPVRTERAILNASFPSPEALWAALWEGMCLRELLRDSPPASVAAIRRAVEEAAQPFFSSGRQRVELPSEVLLALARA